jgi:hypothetical protein
LKDDAIKEAFELLKKEIENKKLRKEEDKNLIKV